MIKLNSHQYPRVKDLNISKEYALDILKNNDKYETLEKKFLKGFDKNSLKTFSFNKDGFLSLLCELGSKGKIAISKGESEALIEAGEFYESLGFKVFWIELLKDGKVDMKGLKDLDVDFLFISSYVMDTYIKTDIKKIKKFSNAKVISNATFKVSSDSDLIYFDPYKLSGFSTSGVILFNDELKEQTIGYKDNLSVVLIFELLEKLLFNPSVKELFRVVLEEKFGDDLYYFVDSDQTLDFTLHFGLKGIKARELIRTLALDEICITNGEGCSLGLSRPSRVIQQMGYKEEISRNAISLSFKEYMTGYELEKVIDLIYKRYKQIRILNGQ